MLSLALQFVSDVLFFEWDSDDEVVTNAVSFSVKMNFFINKPVGEQKTVQTTIFIILPLILLSFFFSSVACSPYDVELRCKMGLLLLLCCRSPTSSGYLGTWYLANLLVDDWARCCAKTADRWANGGDTDFASGFGNLFGE